MVENSRPGKAVEHVQHVGVGRQQARVIYLLNVIILFSGIIIGYCGAVVAYRNKIWPPAPPSDPVAMVDHIARTYDLTAEQRKKLSAAVNEHMETMREIWRLHNADLRETREKLLAAIKDILTDEQYAKWQQEERDVRQEMAQRRQPWMIRDRGSGRRGSGDRMDNGGRMGPGGPGGRQGGGFRGGRGGPVGGEGFRSGMRGWMPGPMEGLNLTDEQKSKIDQIQAEALDKAGQADSMEARRKIRDDMRKAVEGVLTEQQLQKWQQMQADMRQRFGGPGGGGGFRPGGGMGPGDFNGLRPPEMMPAEPNGR